MNIALASVVMAFLSLHLIAPPQSQTVVLKVRSSKPSSDGKSTVVTLESGTTVTIPTVDIDGGVSTPPSTAGAGDPALDTSVIRPKCAKEWPDDFSVRAFCEKTQHEAVEALRARSMNTADQRTIRNKCAKEWPDDLSVRNFCEKTQLEALKKLGR